jgi:hypothetical protein
LPTAAVFKKESGERLDAVGAGGINKIAALALYLQEPSRNEFFEVKAERWTWNPKGLHHLTRREALLAFLYNKPKEVQPGLLA